jgi:SAM-dependent methyltransferase
MGMTAEHFIKTWKNAQGGERPQAQAFLIDFCDLIGVARPMDGDYKFEYPVRSNTGTDRLDLYKRGAFIIEAKQTRIKQTKKSDSQTDLLGTTDLTDTTSRTSRTWDVAMMNARHQAQDYARILPSSHEAPPFIIVCDVGHCFEIYSDFTGKGRHFDQFPDRQSFRVYMDDLAKPDILARFKLIWENPHELNPAKHAAKATREIAKALAEVSKRLEAKKHPPEEVALFLMRCLFTMFAEDTELLPKNSFTDLLEHATESPDSFVALISELWRCMNTKSKDDPRGTFCNAIRTHVKHFNGNLFTNAQVFKMSREDIGVLKVAASKDWREVDPSIFGTLLEQALNPSDRAALGAHYTPRAYVERLVNATVIDPLLTEWQYVQGTFGDDTITPADIISRITDFHRKLCKTRVLDPACGTGNFLYVTLELMKKLEGDVLDALERWGGQEALRLEDFTVDPQQFLGIEKNPRAAAIAELVLWIGYLRWHLKTKGEQPPEPILREFKNIERRDAVLEYKDVAADGSLVGLKRPDWPDAEFIVGNPPFIGGKDVRAQLGDSYVEALWKVHKSMNDSADFVMYWWDHAAELLTKKKTVLRRFGLVTTNSITQVFQRRTLERHLTAKQPISIVMAIGDHPWTKVTSDSAAVRIAMTVAEVGKQEGKLLEVISETGLDTDDPKISFGEISGTINSDLTVGIDVSSSSELRANDGLCYRGVQLIGSGFIVTPAEAQHLGLGKREGLEKHIRLYRNGRDLTGNPRNVMVIDLFGLEATEVRERFPEVYQHIVQTVKPERDQNNRDSYKRLWWVFGEPRKDLRPALNGLSRYIATVETAKHRIFQFLDAEILPDNMIVCVATKDAVDLGILSSRFHVTWVLSQGGTLEDRPRYTKSHCFDPFPFPSATKAQRAEIARIAEGLDQHRKDAQRRHPEITLTQMYNVLEKVRAGATLLPSPFTGEGAAKPRERDVKTASLPSPVSLRLTPSPARGEGLALTPDEKLIFDNALILILKEHHDELDAAVASAYGWPVDLAEDEILARLVALNKERAAEEAKGFVRWLRPEYQIPRFGSDAEKKQLEAFEDVEQTPAAAAKTVKPNFPTDAVDQVAAVMAALALYEDKVTAAKLALGFKQGKKCEARVSATLASLTRTGFIAASKDATAFAIRRAG